jgi:uncharacterized protein with von Willebrand factor type A (vWA) domain
MAIQGAYVGLSLAVQIGAATGMRRRLLLAGAAASLAVAIWTMHFIGMMAQGIGGGARIGDSLATFNRWHARRVINSRTAVMIVSDGYDTGEPEGLAEEMRRLRRCCRKIVWLNPLIGWRDYSPQARGMQAALPYIDLFAPAHNLQSLAALEPYLANL